ncbi:hypothetical protein Hdeb2414_s0006g00215541 [Helianthus debilis subsp. tardiflorus]
MWWGPILHPPPSSFWLIPSPSAYVAPTWRLIPVGMSQTIPSSLMDFSFKRRKTRGLAGISVVAFLGTGIWIGGLLKQRGYDYDDVIVKKSIKLLDFKDSGSAYAGPFSMVYWVIGALADDSVILSAGTDFLLNLSRVRHHPYKCSRTVRTVRVIK